MADETRLQPGRSAARGSAAAGTGRANRGIPSIAIIAACTVVVVVVGLVAFVLVHGAGNGSQAAVAATTTPIDASVVPPAAPPVPAPISTVTVTAPAPAAPAVAPPAPAVSMPQDAAGTVDALYADWSSRDDAGVRRLVTAGVYPKFAAAFLDHNDIDSVSNSTNTDERNATGERVCSTQTFYHRSGKQQQEHRCFQVQAGSSGDIVVDSQGPWAITEWH